MEKKQATGSQDRAVAPQMHLRTDLRGGASVDNCLQNLEYWKNNYYKQYQITNTYKPTPCNGQI